MTHQRRRTHYRYLRGLIAIFHHGKQLDNAWPRLAQAIQYPFVPLVSLRATTGGRCRDVGIPIFAAYDAPTLSPAAFLVSPSPSRSNCSSAEAMSALSSDGVFIITALEADARGTSSAASAFPE